MEIRSFCTSNFFSMHRTVLKIIIMIIIMDFSLCCSTFPFISEWNVLLVVRLKFMNWWDNVGSGRQMKGQLSKKFTTRLKICSKSPASLKVRQEYRLEWEEIIWSILTRVCFFFCGAQKLKNSCKGVATSRIKKVEPKTLQIPKHHHSRPLTLKVLILVL